MDILRLRHIYSVLYHHAALQYINDFLECQMSTLIRIFQLS